MPPFTTPSAEDDRSTVARIAAFTSWSHTEDRSARTAPARAALEEKFLREAGGDPKRAEAARRAYYLRLGRKSAQARRKAKEGAATARADAELDAIMRPIPTAKAG
jgi:hypothetical protein